MVRFDSVVSLRKLRALVVFVVVALLLQASYLARPPPPEDSWLWTVRHVVLTPIVWAIRRWGPLVRGSCVPVPDVSSAPCISRSVGGQTGALVCVNGSDAVEIVTGTEKPEPYNALCWKTLRRYAARHGYGFEDVSAVMQVVNRTSEPLPKWARPHWLKVPALETRFRFSRAEWLVWMDADVVIVNDNVTMEQLLGTGSRDESVGMIISVDDGGLNTGVFALRRNAAGADVLGEWRSYLDGPIYDPWDQLAVREMFNRRTGHYSEDEVESMRTNPLALALRSRGFYVLRQCAINSTPLISLGQETYMVGDFLVHFYSLWADRKMWCISNLVDRGILPGPECT